MARDSEKSEPLKTLEEVEREHIERVLKETAGNKTEAAKILGIDRRTLLRRGFKRERSES